MRRDIRQLLLYVVLLGVYLLVYYAFGFEITVISGIVFIIHQQIIQGD